MLSAAQPSSELITMADQAVKSSLAAEQASFPRSDPPAISSTNANTAITVDAVRMLFLRDVTNII